LAYEHCYDTTLCDLNRYMKQLNYTNKKKYLWPCNLLNQQKELNVRLCEKWWIKIKNEWESTICSVGTEVKSFHFSLDSFNYLTQTCCKTQQPLTLHEIIMTFLVKF